MENNEIKKRVSAVVIGEDRILLIKRVKPGIEYYTFPGGSVEEGESDEVAMSRETLEELGIGGKIQQKIFEVNNNGKKEIYFLVGKYVGVPELGGPEKERMSEQNQYHLEWVNLAKIGSMGNVYPYEAVKKLLEFINKKKQAS
ncbi:MAG: NUDIX domain-containing protein [Candidatus Paceibacterota bacterium]|jgi:8-oxo-dGTP pyrophosphatase MutT (NUDIX family)